ncbi:DUF2171 domain-containing protein [Deinococcus yavapaiensis]|uniref:DUF2171 domain-containing protein n=1 Tax=Deinococcus yavapaiensis KR-236 TaxID=694435 RepID=A0A318S1V3_9DEIO|nr:DUF2171 domain-containing protein [Deinococcus yavapaiensis]PYE51206.1 hypothetical protein DES52_115138 [Deinococcus yavapaiensis KR-236]
MNSENIREHMMVHAKGDGQMMGAKGVHVGTVDKVEGSFIKLTRNDSPDGQHHYIPMTWVESVDDKAVYLSKSEQDVRREWTTDMQGGMSADGSTNDGAISDEERMDRAAQAGNYGAFGQGEHRQATTREEAEAAFSGMTGSGDAQQGMQSGMSGMQGTMMSTSGAMGASDMGGATGIEHIGTAGMGRDADMSGMAAGSGGAMLGSMASGSEGAGLSTSSMSSMGSTDADTTGMGLGAGGSMGGPSLGGAGMATSGTGQMGMSGMQDRGMGAMSDMDSLTSSGGPRMSDDEIATTGASSPMGDASTSGMLSSGTGRMDDGDRQIGGMTDSYASGFDNNSTDRSMMSGAGGMGGRMDDRNSATGMSGNSSMTNEGGVVGQGRDSADLANGGDVQGMDAYDNSYSGGSAAMPRAGGSAAQPSDTMNTNLDAALLGSDFDRDSMGMGVDGTTPSDTTSSNTSDSTRSTDSSRNDR